MSARLRVPLPTRGEDLRLVARTARLVLAAPAYALLAVLAGALGLTLFVVSQNLALVSTVVLGGSLPLPNRLVVLAELYPFVGSSYGPLQGLALLAVAALVGVNLAMATYHFREHRVGVAEGSGSLVGVALGFLGAGCAACGSAVLVGLLSLVGAGGAVLLLPFDGLEFTALAVVALLLSTYWLADGMRGGEIHGCPVDIR
jgi:hypothetical protein